MMQRNSFLCDVDGVLALFNDAYLALLNDHRDVPLMVPKGWEPGEWNWMEALGFSKTEIQAAWDTIRRQPFEFWGNLRPYPEARNILKALRGREMVGDAVYFATVRSPEGPAREATVRWLERYGFHHPSVIVVPPSGNKGVIAAGLQATVVIDDKPANLHDCVRFAHTEHLWLVDRKWNQDTQQYTRVSEAALAARIRYFGQLKEAA